MSAACSQLGKRNLVVIALQQAVVRFPENLEA